MTDHLLLEEAALNAWPALQTALLGGWVARFANGYTKRANSATPLYTPDPAPALEEQIAACEALYKRWEQPTIFRLPSFLPTTAVLDQTLAARGYHTLDETLVQTLDLDTVTVETRRGFLLLPRSEGLDSWLNAFHALNPARRDWDTHRQMLRRITGDLALAGIMADGELVGCGLGVVENGRCGLFDMVVDEKRRRQGYGRGLLNGLLAWAKQRDAHTAYLQVMVDNPAAQALYQSVGFQTAYRYWYRKT